MYNHLQYKDHQEMSAAAADIIIDALSANPNLVLCMASGSTPALMCDLLVQKIKAKQVKTDGLTFIGLDEWVGLSPDNTGSCKYFFRHKLIEPLGLKEEQVHLFNGQSATLEKECEKMDEVILDKGIDVMVVGIGMNGHIGFNEPGTPANIKCHVIELEETTVAVGQKYFTEATALGRGITVGLGHLMNAKQLILLANGAHKKEVVQRAIHGQRDLAFPATIIQDHPNCLVITDPMER